MQLAASGGVKARNGRQRSALSSNQVLARCAPRQPNATRWSLQHAVVDARPLPRSSYGAELLRAAEDANGLDASAGAAQSFDRAE